MKTRQPLLFLLALFVLSGSLIAALATTAQRDYELRGYVNPTQTVELPFRVPRLGINAALTQYSADELRTQFELMQNAHFVWVRQFVYWDQLETSPGEYDWSAWDTITDTLSEFDGLELVVVFMNSPDWSRENTDVTRTAPPDDPQAFGRFVSAFAQRYGNQVNYYQIWDEPNLTATWGSLDPRPVEYAALLQAGYTAIHSGDPTSTVIAAALAPTTETGSRNISDWLYLSDLYALGAADYADAFAGKPYGFDFSPLDREVRADKLNFSRFVGLREVMEQAGDRKTPLWASNWGWNSLPDTWEGTPSIWGSVDAQTRNDYTLAALDRAEREWAWLGGMILYHWLPDAPSDDPIWGFALRNPDGTATALYDALVTRQPHLAASNGLYPAANPYAQYSGVWTFSPLGADIGWLRDSRLVFKFTGRSVGLLLRKDNYVGYLYPKIDEQAPLANVVPRDTAGNPYIILTSETLEPELTLVVVGKNLPDTQHTLSAVADRGYDQYALVGYAVSSGDLSIPYNTQIAIAWFAVITSFTAVLVTGWNIPWRSVFAPLQSIWDRFSSAGRLALGAATSLLVMIGMLLTWGDAVPAVFRRESVQLGLSFLTAGLIYVNPALPITLLAVLLLFFILYNHPTYGLALIIFYAPFFLFPVELYRFAFPMAELLILLTFSAWILRNLTTWAGTRTPITLAIKFHPLDLCVLAWVVLGVISLLWVTRRNPAITELRTLIIEPALFYWMFRSMRPTRTDLLRIIDTLLLAGFLVSIIGLFLYVQGEAIITAEDASRRLASVYGSPNNVALFLGRCLPFALAFCLIKSDRMRQVAAGCGAVIMLVTILLTQSVGAFLFGLPAMIAAALLAIYRRRAILPLLGIFILVGIGFFIGVNSSERFARALDFTQGTNFYRVRVWQSAINMIHDSPITGLGLDQFLYAFRGHYIYPDAWQEPNLSHPHNFLLDSWVRLGIGGVVIFLTTQFFFWRRLLPQLSQTTDRLKFALTVGCIGSMVNLLAHGLVDNSIYVQDLALIFVLLLALAVSLSQQSVENTP